MQQAIPVKAKPVNTSSYLYQVRHMNLRQVVNTMEQKNLTKIALPAVIEEVNDNAEVQRDYLDQEIRIKTRPRHHHLTMNVSRPML